MKLLQHSWSDMLVLDHLHQRIHNNLPDETTLHNGQKFDLLCLGLLGVPSLADLFNNLSSKLQELKFDPSDYICMKFLMLLNHGSFHFAFHFEDKYRVSSSLSEEFLKFAFLNKQIAPKLIAANKCCSFLLNFLDLNAFYYLQMSEGW